MPFASSLSQPPHVGVHGEIEFVKQVEAETSGTPGLPVRVGRLLHPLPVRIMHWINAVVMLVMITSGWGIYDGDVIIRGFRFSQFWRLGDWAAWSLNWHFAGMCSSLSTG